MTPRIARQTWRTHSALVLACLIGTGVTALAGDGSRHFNFTYDMTVRALPDDARVVDLWIPVPRDSDSQRVRSVRIDAPFTGSFETESAYGNRVWHARVTRPLAEPVTVTMHLEIERSVRRPAPSGGDPVRVAPRGFLRPNRLVPLTDRFAKLADRATSGATDRLARARSLYDYVLGRMTYDKSGQGWGRGDANFACDIGKGNCSDFHSLFIALGRSVNIPARFWIGFPLPTERGRGAINGYHCWAESWLPGTGWVPVDISEADKHPERAEFYFGGLDENRVAFTLGRDLVLSPEQKGSPLNFFVYPYVEVDGRSWDDIERRFSFEDIQQSK